MEETERKESPLGTEPTGRLLRKFAVPSVVAMIVGALYNIVDQFFIGRSVGELGNAATNIAYPLSTCCIAIALLCGIGGASAFNIAMGEKKQDEATEYMGNALCLLLVLGVTLSLVTELFLTPMLRFFGSPDAVLPYAKTYTGITALGFPFLILTSGGGHLVRADGRPNVAMFCNLFGAIANVFLDALFVFVFHWGIAGAAAATIIGQYLSGGLIIWNLCRCRTVKLRWRHLRPIPRRMLRVASLGTSPCTNQLAMTVVQIVLNNSLKHYGGLSVYGENIPIAVSGIISKVNMIFMSFVIGCSQGMQPIASYNCGARKFDRVRRVCLQALGAGAAFAVTAFALFQLLPRQIIGIFGNGSEEYVAFAVSYFRIYLFFTFLNFMQPITSNFFTSIGKPRVGVVLSLTRQVFFLLPLIIILPLFLGIDGIMYAGPTADFTAALVSFLMLWKEFRGENYRRLRDR